MTFEHQWTIIRFPVFAIRQTETYSLPSCRSPVNLQALVYFPARVSAAHRPNGPYFEFSASAEICATSRESLWLLADLRSAGGKQWSCGGWAKWGLPALLLSQLLLQTPRVTIVYLSFSFAAIIPQLWAVQTNMLYLLTNINRFQPCFKSDWFEFVNRAVRGFGHLTVTSSKPTLGKTHRIKIFADMAQEIAFYLHNEWVCCDSITGL